MSREQVSVSPLALCYANDGDVHATADGKTTICDLVVTSVPSAPPGLSCDACFYAQPAYLQGDREPITFSEANWRRVEREGKSYGTL